MHHIHHEEKIEIESDGVAKALHTSRKELTFQLKILGKNYHATIDNGAFSIWLDHDTFVSAVKKYSRNSTEFAKGADGEKLDAIGKDLCGSTSDVQENE